jgi:hypothetical protein
MRKIDYVSVFLCAIAAALCYIGSPFASLVFCASSSIGLVDAIRNKVIPAALINGIFLTLNLATAFKTFF